MKKNLTIVRGDSYDLKLVYKAAGVPVDLTGWQAEIGFSWQCEGVTLPMLVAPAGEISVTVPPEVSLSFPDLGPVDYQVRIYSTNRTVVTTLLSGAVKVEESAIDRRSCN